MELHHTLLLFFPCAVMLMYPIAVFVMLKRFYKMTAWHAAQCMLEQALKPTPKWHPLQETVLKKKKRKKNMKKNRIKKHH